MPIEQELNPGPTPDQEQPPVAEQEPTAPNQLEDFSKLDAEQKAERIGEVLKDSAELASAYQDIELKVAGGKKELTKQEKLGWTDRFKVWRAGGQESAPGKVKEKEIKKENFKKRSLAEIAEIAHQAVEMKLGVIEQTQGQQLLDQRAALVAHEKNAVGDLKNLEGLGVHSEDELKDIKIRLGEEKATMEQDVKHREEELDKKLAEFSEPAKEKKEQLDACAVEYRGYLDNVTGEIRTVRGNITKFERGLDGLKSTGPAAVDYRRKISQAIEEQKKNLAKLEASEQALKQRLDLVKANQSQVNDYLEKVNNIGKTKEEVRQLKDEARRKEKEKAGGQARGGEQPAGVRGNEGGEAAAESGDEDLDGSGEVTENEVGGKKSTEAGDAPAKTEAAGGEKETKGEKPTTKPTPEAAISEEQTGEEKEEWKKIKNSVRLWSALLSISTVKQNEMPFQDNFKLEGKEYDNTASFTGEQAQRAFIGYYIAIKSGEMTPDQARKTAQEIFKKKIIDQLKK